MVYCFIRRSQQQWWSLETWSRSRDLSRDPFLRVSVSKVSGLETLNIAKIWFINIYIIQIFLFVVFAGKKQPKHMGKMPETLKTSSQKHGPPQKLFHGANSIFFLSFPCCWWYNANARSQNALLFLHHNENAPATQGRNEGVRGTQFPGRRITVEAP